MLKNNTTIFNIMQALEKGFMEKLVLIDGNSLINRAFYAMPLLTTKNGEPTNAVYGFMNMFFKMYSEIRPTYVAVAFDLKAPTFRHKIYADYKGTRKPMPDELRPQLPMLKSVLRLMGVAVIEKEGLEADDIIGTIAKHTDIQTIIYTGDKDALQLVDGETSVFFTKRGITDIEIYSNDNFVEKTGITPPQIIELKALMGDSSDNIPGIAGVGEKTALSLLQKYGNIDVMFLRTDEITGKLHEKIINGKETAYLSRTLATINTDCGIDTDVNKMRITFPFSAEVKRKFVELEFKSLSGRNDLFVTDGEPQTQPIEEKQINLVTLDELSALSNVKWNGSITIVIKPDCVNLFDGGNTEYKLKTRQSLLDDGFNAAEILRELNGVFNGKTKLIVFSKKDLQHYLANTVGITLTAPCEDVSLIKYLVDFAGGSESYEEVVLEYGKENLLPAYALYSLYQTLYQKLIDESMEKLYSDIELPLSDLLYEMEMTGVKVDINTLEEMGKRYSSILVDVEAKIKEYADEPNLNINSPKQLGEVLFEKLKIGKGKKTKTGYSTSAEILEELEDAHPIVPLILRHRQISKLLSTYIVGLKPLVDNRTGLTHTSFNQTVTATGRLSSKEPNLQNIPVRDSEGREIRKCFVPRDENRIFVGADYSQIELRLLAAFSGCKALIEAYKEGRDIHSETASKVFRVPLAQVTKDMRRDAKAVNFGIIYGMSEFGLAKNLKISTARAREYIETYFEQYPEVKAYMENNVKFAKEHGYAVTLFGRKRFIREMQSSNYNLRQFGERVAMNMPLQGSSADIIKVAMLNVAKRLKDENLQSKLVLSVHDELIIDALISEQEQVEKLLKEEMENAVELSVPLTVEVGSGKTWFDA